MIIVTFRMLGKPRIKDLTATCRPLFLDISLKILNTLNALKSLERGVIAIIEKTMMTKSS
jgi:hypothetical protein